jgi:uncharacterized damage-inducible protein DinB
MIRSLRGNRRNTAFSEYHHRITGQRGSDQLFERINFMRIQFRVFFFLVAVLWIMGVGFAQQPGETAFPAGFRGDILKQLRDVEKKIEDLAEAMPESTYSWRPMEGVRSVSEVYMHIAQTNYTMPTFFGAKAAEGIDKDLEKHVTEKKMVIDVLKKSFAYIRDAVLRTPDTDLVKGAVFFGDSTTVGDVILQAALHMHEHLGQSIAYARMNRIVPPWTAALQAREKAAGKQ